MTKATRIELEQLRDIVHALSWADFFGAIRPHPDYKKGCDCLACTSYLEFRMVFPRHTENPMTDQKW